MPYAIIELLQKNIPIRKKVSLLSGSVIICAIITQTRFFHGQLIGTINIGKAASFLGYPYTPVLIQGNAIDFILFSFANLMAV